MPEPRVVIIIVNWNGKRDTLECLASLSEESYQTKEIVVVDNGSQDDSAAEIRRAYPEVTVLETGSNLGFTGGNNFGIRYALDTDPDYVYFLNNDTIVDPGALEALVTSLGSHPAYGLVTPVIHYFDDRKAVWFSGSRMDLKRGQAVHDNSRIPAATDPPYEVPWASGCAMLIRADLLKQLGGFDDRYFLIWEDVDLSMRLRALGFSIAIVPAARIYHKVSQSFSGHSRTGCYYHVRNNLLFVSLHNKSGYWRAACTIVVSRGYDCLCAIKDRLPASSQPMRPTLQAVRDHLLRRYGCLNRRP